MDHVKLEQESPKLLKKMFFIIIIAILLYISFVFWGDFAKVKSLINSIPLRIYAVCLISALTGYFVRVIKWHYSLSVLQVQIPTSKSTEIFFIGMAFAISPGKLGELIKSYFLKKHFNIEMARTIPIIFADHLTTLIAWLIFIVFTFNSYLISYKVFIAFCSLVLCLYLLIRRKRFITWLLEKVTNIRFLYKYKTGVLSFYHHTEVLIRFKPLCITVFLSLISSFTECVPLFVLLQTIEHDISLTQSIFIVALGTIASTLSMIPGGIGVIEGSVVGFLMYLGLNRSSAVSISLLERLIVLWFGVFIGLFIFFLRRKHYLNDEKPIQ